MTYNMWDSWCCSFIGVFLYTNYSSTSGTYYSYLGKHCKVRKEMKNGQDIQAYHRNQTIHQHKMCFVKEVSLCYKNMGHFGCQWIVSNIMSAESQNSFIDGILLSKSRYSNTSEYNIKGKWNEKLPACLQRNQAIDEANILLLLLIVNAKGKELL